MYIIGLKVLKDLTIQEIFLISRNALDNSEVKKCQKRISISDPFFLDRISINWSFVQYELHYVM